MLSSGQIYITEVILDLQGIYLWSKILSKKTPQDGNAKYSYRRAVLASVHYYEIFLSFKKCMYLDAFQCVG
jgi:hypothetical protein